MEGVAEEGAAEEGAAEVEGGADPRTKCRNLRHILYNYESCAISQHVKISCKDYNLQYLMGFSYYTNSPGSAQVKSG